MNQFRSQPQKKYKNIAQQNFFITPQKQESDETETKKDIQYSFEDSLSEMHIKPQQTPLKSPMKRPQSNYTSKAQLNLKEQKNNMNPPIQNQPKQIPFNRKQMATKMLKGADIQINSSRRESYHQNSVQQTTENDYDQRYTYLGNQDKQFSRNDFSKQEKEYLELSNDVSMISLNTPNNKNQYKENNARKLNTSISSKMIKQHQVSNMKIRKLSTASKQHNQSSTFILNNGDAKQCLNSDDENEVKSLAQKIPPQKANQISAIKNLIHVFSSIKGQFSSVFVQTKQINSLRQMTVLLKQAAKNEENQLKQISSLIYDNENRDSKFETMQYMLTEQNKQLQSILDDKEAKANKFDEIKQKLQQQNKSLQQKLDDQETTGAQFNEIKKQLIERNQILESELQNVTIKLKEMQTSLQENKQQFEKQLKEKDQQLKKSEQENKNMQNKINDLNTELQDEIQKQKKLLIKLMEDISFNKVVKDQSDSSVKNFLEQLNPNVKIEEKQVQFVKAFQNIIQNQPTKEQKDSFQKESNSIVQEYLKLQSQSKNGSQDNSDNSQQSSNSQKDSITQDTVKCLVVMQNMFSKDGIQTFITSDPLQKLEKDESYKIQQSFLQTGLHNQTFYYSLSMDFNTDLFKNLSQSSNVQQFQQFISEFKSNIGQKVNSLNPEKDITIMNVKVDTDPRIDFQVFSEQFNQVQIKKKFTFSDIGASVSVKSLLENAKLSVDMFNPQFNMEWGDSFKGKSDVRGQLKFYDIHQPVNHTYKYPVGYKGYALNVERYGKDKKWLSSNGDEYTWIVLFHGTSEKAIEGITKDNLAPGSRNIYGGKKCRITDTLIKSGLNSNVYLTDEISEAEQYTVNSTTYDGKSYKIIFQCRINPQGVKSPVAKPCYYTVDDNQNIRPYRILLKEV